MDVGWIAGRTVNLSRGGMCIEIPVAVPLGSDLDIDVLKAVNQIEALSLVEHDGALLAERAANARKLGYPDAAYQIADLAYQAAVAGAQPREHRLPRSLPELRETIKSQPISSGLERLLKTLADI